MTIVTPEIRAKLARRGLTVNEVRMDGWTRLDIEPMVRKSRVIQFDAPGHPCSFRSKKLLPRWNRVLRKCFENTFEHARGTDLFRGPVQVHLGFHLPVRSHFDAHKAGKPHDEKPDIDNLQKPVLDVMSGRAFPDDAEVASVRAKKFWCRRGEGGVTGLVASALLTEDEIHRAWAKARRMDD